MAQAFDEVWREGLCYKLSQTTHRNPSGFKKEDAYSAMKANTSPFIYQCEKQTVAIFSDGTAILAVGDSYGEGTGVTSSYQSNLHLDREMKN